MLEPAPGGPCSRRQLLLRGGTAALGAAAGLTGCTNGSAPSNVRLNKHSPGARQDVSVLNGLLELEYRAIAAYTASVPLLAAAIRREQASQQPAHPSAAQGQGPPPLRPVPLLASDAASWFLSLEVDHTIELKAIIKQAGGKPVRPAGSYDLGNPSSKREILLLLHGIEQGQLTAYLRALTLLTPGRLRAAAAAILSNEAQQIMVLRMQLGFPPIPSAFVTGME